MLLQARRSNSDSGVITPRHPRLPVLDSLLLPAISVPSRAGACEETPDAEQLRCFFARETDRLPHRPEPRTNPLCANSV